MSPGTRDNSDPPALRQGSEPVASDRLQARQQDPAGRQSWPFWLLVSVLACILLGTSAVLLRSSLLPLFYWEQSLLRPRLTRSQLLRSTSGNMLLDITAAGHERPMSLDTIRPRSLDATDPDGQLHLLKPDNQHGHLHATQAGYQARALDGSRREAARQPEIEVLPPLLGDLSAEPVDLTEPARESGRQPKTERRPQQQHRISAAVHTQSKSVSEAQRAEAGPPPSVAIRKVWQDTPPAPPGPAESGYGTRPWPPGMNEKAVEKAIKAMEELMSQPNGTADPTRPWNKQATNYTLFKIDQHVRFNPSYRAVTDSGDTVFVKFACFPGNKGHDAAGLCARGMPAGVEELSRGHQASIQAITDECGLSWLKSRTWTAQVHANTPEGIEIEGLMGFFAEWVNGTNPEKWKADGKIEWIKKLGPEWIWLGALHDFILCESDRHQGNLVVTDASTGAFKFIDNDHELNNRAAIGQGFSHVKDKTCIPSSLFLPQNMESWRLLKLGVPLAKLDMRCWTGPTMDIPLPAQVKTCLQQFSSSTPEDLMQRYSMTLLEHAESLHQRAKDLLELGFWKALMRQVEPHESTFWFHPQRLPWSDYMFPHWRLSLWRPLEEPNCSL